MITALVWILSILATAVVSWMAGVLYGLAHNQDAAIKQQQRGDYWFEQYKQATQGREEEWTQ